MAKEIWRTLKRLILILSLSIVTAVFVLFVLACRHDSRLERKFDGITIGMSKEQVLSTMGKPFSTGKCGEVGGVPDDSCYREYLYKPFLTFSGDTMAVFFDSRGRVVGKYYYRSP